MKYLFINVNCSQGSTGSVVMKLADEMLAQGHTVRIAYGRGIPVEKYRNLTYRILTDFDVMVDGVRTRLLDDAGFNSRQTTKKFIKWVESYNPDVIWLHNLHGYYINVEILFDYLKECGKKIFWTLHDCWAITGHCTYFDMAHCMKWKSGCCDCPQSRMYPKSLFVDFSSKNFQKKKDTFTGVKDLTIITPSQWLADLVKASFLKDYPVEVRHNSIDTDVFKPVDSSFRQKYRLVGKKILLGAAMPWSKRKGLFDFIRLAQILPDECALVMIGVTKDIWEKIPNNVIKIGRIRNAKELAEIYSAADVFLNLTYEDNYPTVNLEAQACGTPVITYRTGGSPESVPPENVVDKGDLDSIVSFLKRIPELKIKAPQT